MQRYMITLSLPKASTLITSSGLKMFSSASAAAAVRHMQKSLPTCMQSPAFRSGDGVAVIQCDTVQHMRD